ncbi:MAG: protein translocase subunit SecF [Bryobacterales bacterium]|nr:protein translocase subunit SecF [Bryobacterales bacterium]
MELFRNTNYDFLGKKLPFILLSLVLIGAGLVSIAVKGGIKYGIDFRGGAVMYVKFTGEPPVAEIRSALRDKVAGEVLVQRLTDQDSNEVIVTTELQDDRALNETRQTMVDTLAATFGGGDPSRMDFNNATQESLASYLRDPLAASGAQLSEADLQALVQGVLEFRNTPPRSGLITSFDQLAGVTGVTPEILAVLKDRCTLGRFSVRSVEVVGPKVATDLRRQAVQATLLALAGMLVYIAFRFEWVYGFAAVLAVFHDVVITVGFLSLFDKEVSLTVIAGLLTLVGYSMNDTIVIFDRVRENLKILRRESFETLVNRSVNQTLARTVMTSGLTFLTVLALFLFGGPVLNPFSFTLVVGIIVGTYSSVFIASPVVVWWVNRVESRKRGRAQASQAKPAKTETRPLAKKAR